MIRIFILASALSRPNKTTHVGKEWDNAKDQE